MRRVWTSVGLALAIAMVTLTTWLANRPPATNCDGGAWADSHGGVTLASKVIVRPWYGRHQVYGVFVIPNLYKNRYGQYPVTIIVRGIENHPLSATSVKVPDENITVPPGYDVVRATLETRIALWFILSGQLSDLRAPCNWALVFTNKGR